MIPYGKQSIDEGDIKAVAEVLRSDWLTTGPKVVEFERAFAEYVGAKEAIAVSNGTAALHSAMYAIGIGPGDEVIVPPMTFAASANCVVFQGGTPVFVDVDADTLLLDSAQVESKITPRTKAVIAVDYSGHPCDYDALQVIVNRHGLTLVADACHSLGGRYKGQPVGSLADLSVFSFHPVKHITTGEGGMITTNDPDLASRMRVFRNHGITSDHRQREQRGSWSYEMVDLGYNYRITDFQCAIGLSQLEKLPIWVTRRQELADKYDEAFREMPGIDPLYRKPDISHAFHLYVVGCDEVLLQKSRKQIFTELRAADIGVNVHYIPVYFHPFYSRRFNYEKGLCPNAEHGYEKILSLPMYANLTNGNVKVIIDTLKNILFP